MITELFLSLHDMAPAKLGEILPEGCQSTGELSYPDYERHHLVLVDGVWHSARLGSSNTAIRWPMCGGNAPVLHHPVVAHARFYGVGIVRSGPGALLYCDEIRWGGLPVEHGVPITTGVSVEVGFYALWWSDLVERAEKLMLRANGVKRAVAP